MCERVSLMGDRRITTAKLSLLLAAASVVCSAQMSPIDSGDYAAKAIQVTGRVSVLRDAAEYAIVEGGQVHVKELIFTGPDGQRTIPGLRRIHFRCLSQFARDFPQERSELAGSA